MVWYDSFKIKNSTVVNKRFNKIQNSTLKNSLFRKQNVGSFTLKNIYISTYVIPFGLNLVLLRNTVSSMYNLVLYSDKYYLFLPLFISKNNIKYDYSTRQITIQSKYLNSFTLTYLKMLDVFYNSLISPFFTKIKFKGKGYYIYKNIRNTITPQFGYSHRFYLYAFYVCVKFITKTSLVVFGLNAKHLNLVSHSLVSWRPVNIFTGRGIRFSKQVIYKKSGKVSSYR